MLDSETDDQSMAAGDYSDSAHNKEAREEEDERNDDIAATFCFFGV